MIKKISTTITLPFATFFAKTKKTDASFTQQPQPSFTSSRQQKKFPTNALFIILGLIIFVSILFVIAVRVSPTKTLATQQSTTQAQVPAPYAQQVLNKTFTFSLKNSTGTEVTKFSYTITSADLTNEIIVQGQKASAVAGRTFLILNLTLTNNYKQGIQVNTKDYVRLIVNGKKDQLLAPDIHNDPVEVQAISTKYTRLGFPINTTDKDLTLQVGEIDGTKQFVKLSLQK